MIIPNETMLQTAETSDHAVHETVKLALNKRFVEDIEDTCSSSSSSSIDSSDRSYNTVSEIDESTNDYCSLEDNLKGPLVTPLPASILKSQTKFEPRFIKGDKKNWMCLPAPELQELPARTTTVRSSANGNNINKRVGFDTVLIRSYKQTIGDNPCVSYGPPIQLDWEYEQHDEVDIESFESQRVFSRRSFRQLGLNYYQRKALLTREYGFTEEELAQSKKDTNKAKFRRAVTNHFLPMMGVETALESAGRKAKRIIRKGKQ
jgi:hypothetical protein